MMPKLKIVCVEWDDASFSSGYYEKDNKDMHVPLIVRTVGYLIQRNKSVILIAAEAFEYAARDSDDSDTRHISTIPTKMVRRVTYLTKAKEGRK